MNTKHLHRFLILATTALGAAHADDFDDLEGPTIISLADAATKPHRSLSMESVVALPRVLRDSRAPLLIIKTDQGNLARVLISPGLRKSGGSDGKTTPVALVERFDTFELPGGNNRIASGRDVILFDGFGFDFDIGQVVPQGQGADIQFSAKGKAGEIGAAADARIFTLQKPLESLTDRNHPPRGRPVQPSDFSGRYRFVANGQWSGVLDLNADAAGAISGRFRSDSTGTSYRVTGEIGKRGSNAVDFTIQFPRSTMSVEAWLWTEGKAAMSGTATFLDRPYGFVAVRSGGKLSDVDATVFTERADLETDVDVFVAADGSYHLGEKSADNVAIADAIAEVRKNHDVPRVRISADDSAPFARVRSIISMIRETGPVEMQIAVAIAQD